MKRLVLGLAALFAAMPAAAEPLWENIEAGMTTAEVRRLYPAGDRVRHRADRTTIRGHAISDECRADIHVVHRTGTVNGVVMRGEPAMFARCGGAMLDLLTGRLGPAHSETTGRPSMLQRIRTTYSWNVNNMHVRYVRFSTEGWGGAGLGNASWELSFSPGPEPVTL